jgi:uncharacterized flavoprotein (TIGR03862 family)
LTADPLGGALPDAVLSASAPPETGSREADPRDADPRETGPQETAPQEAGPLDPAPVDPGPLDAVVVGAGPAGLMAAEALARAGRRRVVVVERMPSPARKLLMAGRSGLNLTNTETGAAFLERYGAARPLLEPAIRAFPPARLTRWVERLGIETFVGSSGRVFPRVLKAAPLVRAWLRRLGDLGVTLRTGTRFTGFVDGGIAVSGPAGDTMIAARTVVLAMGGASWPRLGTDGSWAAALDTAGIAVVPFGPSNMALKVAWSADFIARFHGTPLKRLAVGFHDAWQRGEAVVTRGGLEGGGIYPVSAAIRDALAAGEAATLTLDLRPDLTVDELTHRLGEGRSKDSLANRLRKAAGLPPVAVALLRETTGNRLPHEPAELAQAIKRVAVPIAGVAGLERAISSTGGVARDAVAADFMLRDRPGVFVAGEMLDWDAPTGGYLLQAAFATGRAAGLAAVRYLAASDDATG